MKHELERIFNPQDQSQQQVYKPSSLFQTRKNKSGQEKEDVSSSENESNTLGTTSKEAQHAKTSQIDESSKVVGKDKIDISRKDMPDGSVVVDTGCSYTSTFFDKVPQCASFWYHGGADQCQLDVKTAMCLLTEVKDLTHFKIIIFIIDSDI